jgi:hypothetical protein
MPELDLSNVRRNYKQLLAKLGMDDYNMNETVLKNLISEKDALNEAVRVINREFVKRNPGSFIIWDSNIGKYRYGKLSDKLPEYKDYRFIKQ